MPRKRKNRACQAAAPDILSNLPEDIVDLILMRLRLRDAVRTSILSKKWRNTWCRLPKLKLNTTNLVSESKYRDIEPLKDALPGVISHLTTLHPGPITKFTFDIGLPEVSTPIMDNLISFLSRNALQHLHLNFLSTGEQYSLPSSFFTCFQLRYLCLWGFAIQLSPLHFRGFYGLIRLELRSVTISSEILENIICHSPFLEQLDLCQIFMDARVVDIYAPMLRSFVFTGSLIGSVCLKDVSRMVKLSLHNSAEYFLTATRDNHIAKFIKSCSALKHLRLYDEFLSLGAVEVPSRLPFVLHSVTSLYLYDFSSMRVAYFLCLIRCFPNLQFLDIEVMEARDEEKVLEAEHSDITFKHLREVNCDIIDGAVHAVGLMKLLLVKPPMLSRMRIKLRKLSKESERVEMLDELSKWKPASPKVKVDVTVPVDEFYKTYRVNFV